MGTSSASEAAWTSWDHIYTIQCEEDENEDQDAGKLTHGENVPLTNAKLDEPPSIKHHTHTSILIEEEEDDMKRNTHSIVTIGNASSNNLVFGSSSVGISSAVGYACTNTTVEASGVLAWTDRRARNIM